ncbi:MAG: dihydropteroate synthase [Gammaproteobacteria bacterium]|nr:dihydropteroate synthase [Gammaproteobacteria bacterium]
MTKLNLINPERPILMGILNVTPDSFSDGGQYSDINLALRHAEAMLNDGADIIDIGGESTRPGAPAVSVQDEITRVIPVIKALKKEFNCAISLDTSKADVMQSGIDEGVDLINDVCALSQPQAMEVVAQSKVPVCLMHMQGTPRTMQKNPTYNDLIQDIRDFFIDKIAACKTAGIDEHRIILDLGFGFGKTLAHNYQLLNEMDSFLNFNMPILAGISRKSMLGNLLDLPVEQRLNSSIVAATLALTKGAKILRVHDVKETKQAITIFNAMNYGVDNG